MLLECQFTGSSLTVSTVERARGSIDTGMCFLCFCVTPQPLWTFISSRSNPRQFNHQLSPYTIVMTQSESSVIEAPFPAPVKTWHNNTYAAIDPHNPELSAKGKNVVITGGGSGIGPAIARAFAKAGASNIAIVGRTEKTLLVTKTKLEVEFKDLTVFTAVADIANKSAIDKQFSAILDHVGPINILINNAGFLPNVASIREAEIEDWWAGYEINFKGSFVVTQAFLRSAAPDASLLNMTTSIAHLPAIPRMSGYAVSKTASARFFEYVQAENPEIQVINVHPGVIMTPMLQKTMDAGFVFPIDDSKPLCFKPEALLTHDAI